MFWHQPYLPDTSEAHQGFARNWGGGESQPPCPRCPVALHVVDTVQKYGCRPDGWGIKITRLRDRRETVPGQ